MILNAFLRINAIVHVSLSLGTHFHAWIMANDCFVCWLFWTCVYEWIYAHLNHVYNQCISLLLYMCAYMQFIWCIQMFMYGSNNWKHPTQMATSNAISIWNSNTNTSYKIDENMNYFIIQNMQLCRFQNDAHFNPLTCFIKLFVG